MVVWLHTYGAVFADKAAGRPKRRVRYPKGDHRRPLSLKAVKSMPDAIDYDPEERTISFDGCIWGPVEQAVWVVTFAGDDHVATHRPDYPADAVRVVTAYGHHEQPNSVWTQPSRDAECQVLLL